MTISKFFLIIYLLTFSGCGGSHRNITTLISSASIPNRIVPGMKRDEVEGLVGKPYSVQEIISQDPKFQGVEVRVLYSPQLRSMEQQIASDMQDNNEINISSQILSSTLSLAGYAVPGSSMATGVAGSGVGVAKDLASTKLDNTIFDPSVIYSAFVVYRKNRVYSVERRTLSSGPR